MPSSRISAGASGRRGPRPPADLALARLQQAADSAQHRRLPGAVGAHDAGDRRALESGPRPGARRPRRIRRSRRAEGQTRGRRCHGSAYLARARSPRRDRRRGPAGRAGSRPARPSRSSCRARARAPGRRGRARTACCAPRSGTSSPGELSSRIVSPMRSISVGLMPPAGSSSMISLGSSISTCASSTSFCWPKERARAGWSRNFDMPTKSSSSAARSASAPLTAPAASWRKLNVRSGATTFSSTVISRNRRVIWNVRPSPRCARAPRAAARRSAARRRVTVPGVGRHRAVDQVEDRGLAGAVRADQRGDRALGDARTSTRRPRAGRRSASRGPRPRAAGGRRRPPLRPRALRARAARCDRRGGRRPAPALPLVRRRSSQSWTVGMTPRGRNSTVSASSPPKTSRRVLPPPRELLEYSLSPSMANAPRTGPQSVARPPSSIDRMIWTLSRMLNIPCGSMKVR